MKTHKCPKCGSADVRYLEDIISERRVEGFNDDGVLLISGEYTTSGWDEGAANPRLQCPACLHKWPIPDG